MVYTAPCEEDPMLFDAPDPAIDVLKSRGKGTKSDASVAVNRIIRAVALCDECLVRYWCARDRIVETREVLGVRAGALFLDPMAHRFNEHVVPQLEALGIDVRQPATRRRTVDKEVTEEVGSVPPMAHKKGVGNPPASVRGLATLV